MNLTPEATALLGRWTQAASIIAPALAGGGGLSWAEVRESYGKQLAAALPAPQGVTFEQTTLDGVPAMLVVPEEVTDDRTLLYIHGGGYVHGAVEGYIGLTGHYAKRLRARVYVPDYRQAPEHPFPTPIEDVFTAYRALLAAGTAPEKIAISGDSAGGAMVITIMRKARAAGLPLPVAGVAISPWADLTHSGPSARSRAHTDPLCGVDFLEALARSFLGDALPTDPDASPIFADVRGLAPTLIQMGENEVMLSGGVTLADRLAEQRVRTTLEVWPHMFHVWHLLAGHMAESDEALDNAVSFITREYERAR
ncbi:alpha/beta hydrolase [Streptomyces daghestanicus]|uniref:Esterase n=1 Tax=Streptomyces daghestanicus TaxID=66885 RepID=A0ABQ3Q7B8_9ACTN|nr:alpha/beta hydrolase [Streptomyces daghestanicus]GGU69458.1 esterase [Streptomyces daghestanicus]GHI33181.1 esterase [Streptomyces daghestanicus]